MKKQILFSLFGIMVGCVGLIAEDAVPTSADDLSRLEAIRRQQALIQSRDDFKAGQDALKVGNFDQAVKSFEAAYNGIPKNKATELDVKNIRASLLSAHLRAANASLMGKNYDEAMAHVARVNQLDAGNIEGKKVVDQVAAAKAKALVSPAPTAEVAVQSPWDIKQAKLKKWLREGELAFQSGQYNEAQHKFENVLGEDKYNTDAYRSLTLLHKAQDRVYEVAKNYLSQKRLTEVTESWLPVHSARPIVDEDTKGSTSDTSTINKKLKTIVLTKIDFNQATIQEIIEFLRLSSIEGDEADKVTGKKTGVNFVLNLVEAAGATAGGPPAPAPPVSAVPGGVPGGAPPIVGETVVSTGPSIPPISLKMSNVPLYVALEYICRNADLKYRVEPYAVVITNSAVDLTLRTRFFRVIPGVFEPLLTVGGGGGGGGGGASAKLGSTTTQGNVTIKPADVKNFFTESGVGFPVGSSVTYSRATSTLIATNTPDYLDAIDRIMEAINKPTMQVEIEARFVEVSQGLLNELGFNWSLPNGIPFNVGGHPLRLGESAATGGTNLTAGLRDISTLAKNTVDALLSQDNTFLAGSSASGADALISLAGASSRPQFKVVLKAISQNKSTDLLSAPRVTTVSGANADIKVARDFKYPTDFTPATATAAGGGTTGGGAVAVVPATPSGFETREIGVLLNVQPTVGEDKYTISLVCIPEVADFDGFINYGGEIQVPAGNQVVKVSNPILQPIFSTRKVTTTLTIWDGQTVVMGGLIRDDRQQINDKVPFLGDVPVLGRLFRSKVITITKRNLMIFVTATLVNPDGSPVHKQMIEGVDMTRTGRIVGQ